MPSSCKILTPTGHLGLTPLEADSFKAGCALNPDYIIADSGSSDIGPVALGSDTSTSPIEWQRYDLETMLLEARKLNVPMIIGSASDAGTNSGVDRYIEIIKEVADKHNLPSFRMAAIYAEQDIDSLAQNTGDEISLLGLDGREDATEELIKESTRIVAAMGAEPIKVALENGADVIIAGRSVDIALFAAPLLLQGYSPEVAYYAGKALECASYCAEPFMGKESVMAVVESDAVNVTPLHPKQRCTPLSIFSQTLYERSDPFHEWVPGGYLDMSELEYEQKDERTTRVTGMKFVPTEPYKIKLEGAKYLGERRLSIATMRDAWSIQNVDKAIAWAKGKLAEKFGEPGETYEVFYHVYGKNGVLGELEPNAKPCHELCIIVEASAPTASLSHEVCTMAARNLLFARLPGKPGGTGVAAPMTDEIMSGAPAYEWNLNHLLVVSDPCALFQQKIITAGIGA